MRLLLVEPHCLLARALKMGMDEEGIAVEVVGDQQTADERLRECTYDVILLDSLGGTVCIPFSVGVAPASARRC